MAELNSHDSGKSRPRPQQQPSGRESREKQVARGLDAGWEEMHHPGETLLGGDYSQSTFERHAALLGDSRMARPMYAQQRATIVQQLQRDYGNRYVQRLVKHISQQRTEAVQRKQEEQSEALDEQLPDPTSELAMSSRQTLAQRKETDPAFLESAIQRFRAIEASPGGLSGQRELYHPWEALLPPGLVRGRASEPITRTTADPIQPKLAVGPAGDKYEQEADRVAKQVVGMTSSPGQEPAQRQDLEDEELQMKPLLQRLPDAGGGGVEPEVEQSIQQARGGGQALPDKVRASMEGAFGADFSGVRVHTGPESNALNDSMSARAFTTGQDIFFRKGEYNPRSASGQELLAHELTHVVHTAAVADRVVQGESAEALLDVGSAGVGGGGVVQTKKFNWLGVSTPLASKYDTSKESDFAQKIRNTTRLFVLRRIRDRLQGIPNRAIHENKALKIVKIAVAIREGDHYMFDYETAVNRMSEVSVDTAEKIFWTTNDVLKRYMYETITKPIMKAAVMRVVREWVFELPDPLDFEQMEEVFGERDVEELRAMHARLTKLQRSGDRFLLGLLSNIKKSIVSKEQPDGSNPLARTSKNKWWRLFINVGNTEPEGNPLYFDADKSPGYYNMMMGAFEEYLQGIDPSKERQIMSPDEYIKYHESLVKGVTDSNDQIEGTLTSGGNGFGTGISWENRNKKAIKGLVKEGVLDPSEASNKTEAMKIREKGSESNSIVFQDQNGIVNILTLYKDKDEAKKKLKGLLDQYYENMRKNDLEQSQKTRDGRKQYYIAQLVRGLHVSHLFGDANGRLNTQLVLNRLLLEEGFNPVILKGQENAEFGGKATLGKLVVLIKRGMERFVQLTQEPSEREVEVVNEEPITGSISKDYAIVDV